MLRFVGASKLLIQIFTFIGHIQRATVDYYMTDVARANNGLGMHRPKKKSELMNDTCIKACINKFVSGAYDRLQFLKTVSHSLGVHTPSLHDSDDEDDDEVPQPPSPTDAAAIPAVAASTTSSSEVADCCEVCLLVPQTSVALEFSHVLC